MAIDITVTIPGELSDPTSPVSRIKRAIDGNTEGLEDAPSTPAEYKDYVMTLLVAELRQFVRRYEIDVARAAAAADPLDVDAA